MELCPNSYPTFSSSRTLSILVLLSCTSMVSSIRDTQEWGTHMWVPWPIYFAERKLNKSYMLLLGSLYLLELSSCQQHSACQRDSELPSFSSWGHLWLKWDGERSSLSPLYQKRWHIWGNGCLSPVRYEEIHELFISSISWHWWRVARAVK